LIRSACHCKCLQRLHCLFRLTCYYNWPDLHVTVNAFRGCTVCSDLNVTVNAYRGCTVCSGLRVIITGQPCMILCIKGMFGRGFILLCIYAIFGTGFHITVYIRHFWQGFHITVYVRHFWHRGSICRIHLHTSWPTLLVMLTLLSNHSTLAHIYS